METTHKKIWAIRSKYSFIESTTTFYNTKEEAQQKLDSLKNNENLVVDHKHIEVKPC